MPLILPAVNVAIVAASLTIIVSPCFKPWLAWVTSISAVPSIVLKALISSFCFIVPCIVPVTTVALVKPVIIISVP